MKPLRKRKDENVQHPFKQICARNEINPLLFLFSIPLPPPLDQTKQNEDQVLTPACAPRRASLGTCAGHSESSRTMFSPEFLTTNQENHGFWVRFLRCDVLFRIFFIQKATSPSFIPVLVDLHSRFFIIEGKHWFLAGHHMSPTQTMHCLEGFAACLIFPKWIIQ